MGLLISLRPLHNYSTFIGFKNYYTTGLQLYTTLCNTNVHNTKTQICAPLVGSIRLVRLVVDCNRLVAGNPLDGVPFVDNLLVEGNLPHILLVGSLVVGSFVVGSLLLQKYK